MSQTLSYRSPGSIPPTPQRRGAWRGLAGWVVFITLAIVLVILFSQRRADYLPVPLSDFNNAFLAGRVTNVTIDGDELYGSFVTPQVIIRPTGGPVTVRKFRAEVPAGAVNWQFTEWLLSRSDRTRVEVVNGNNFLTQVLVPFIPWISIFLFVWFFVFRSLRKNASLTPQPATINPSPERTP